MTIAQIVESEGENTGKIHLYREGLFLKAYNHSAFLFQKHVRSFRPIKKFYKSVGGDVVMLGFPSAHLQSVFPDGNFESSDDSHVCIACPEGFDLREYSLWFDTVQPAPEKPKKSVSAPETPRPYGGSSAAYSVTLFDANNVDTLHHPGRNVIDEVVEQLEAFSIENSTPMECMMFLSRLKTELKKGKSGGI